MLNIATQIAKDNSNIFNAKEINNIIYDNPLKFFSDKKLQDNSELDSYIEAMYYLVNKDILKMRFGGSNYKYEYLLDLLSIYAMEGIEIKSEDLDDGYKSISKCIVKAVGLFNLRVSDNRDYLELRDFDGLKAEVENMGLQIKYTECVDSFEKFSESKNKAENIIRELAPYINCASQYGNFFQFNNIFIKEDLENARFIPKEVKFRVSNNIIPNLIKPLYGNSPECGLREIIQNACDACKEMNDIFKKASITDKLANNNDVELRISRTNEKCKLIVRDFGTGMDTDVLLNRYFIIGESSKSQINLDLVGQFGIGVLATFLLGDKISIKTKHWETEEILSFSYDLGLDKEESRNINITKECDNNFKCGTEVIVELNEELSSLNDNELEKRLKINEWYILPDIAIKYFMDDKEKQLFSLRGEKYIWKNLISEKNLIVDYLEGEYNGPKIIYNGIAITEEYEFKCEYIYKKPCIAIKSFDKGIKLNLERSKIESGLEKIVEKLEEELITLSLKELCESKSEIIDHHGDIKKNNFTGGYLYKLPLFFCKDGVGVFSQKTLIELLSKSQNNYKNIVYINGYNGYPLLNINELHEDGIYLFDSDYLGKKEIADLIEGYGKVHVPVEIVKKYFLDANSSSYGFRMKSMQKLYSIFNVTMDQYEDSTDFWNKHKNKKDLFEEYFSEPGYIEIGENSQNVNILKNKLNDVIISSYALYAYKSNIKTEYMDIGIIK